MKKAEIDYWIASMLASQPSVSDLNITVGRTLQVESSGRLLPVQRSGTCDGRTYHCLPCTLGYRSCEYNRTTE